MQTTGVVTGAVALGIATTGGAAALPGKPDFGPHIYADGVAWGTKVTAVLPHPKGNNHHSFDALYVVTNSNNPGQQPGTGVTLVGEAGPGNPEYNGGRWDTHGVMWTQSGFSAHGTVPVLKSEGDVMFHEGLGHLTISEVSPGPPEYFECPLLPVKD